MHPLRSSLIVTALAFVVSALPAAAQQKRTSPHESIYARIGRPPNLVGITYGRPYTNDPKTGEPRKIWGNLVPWDQPWRLGADEATLFLVQKPVTIAGTTIPAGAYTLYLVPSETSPTKLAVSSAIGKWGIPVDEKHDVARLDMTKSQLEKPVDQLTLAIENDPASGGGVIKIMWESTQFSVSFSNATPPST